jgi:hypothetical protein
MSAIGDAAGTARPGRNEPDHRRYWYRLGVVVLMLVPVQMAFIPMLPRRQRAPAADGIAGPRAADSGAWTITTT